MVRVQYSTANAAVWERANGRWYMNGSTSDYSWPVVTDSAVEIPLLFPGETL